MVNFYQTADVFINATALAGMFVVWAAFTKEAFKFSRQIFSDMIVAAQGDYPKIECSWCHKLYDEIDLCDECRE